MKRLHHLNYLNPLNHWNHWNHWNRWNHRVPATALARMAAVLFTAACTVHAGAGAQELESPSGGWKRGALVDQSDKPAVAGDENLLCLHVVNLGSISADEDWEGANASEPSRGPSDQQASKSHRCNGND